MKPNYNLVQSLNGTLPITGSIYFTSSDEERFGAALLSLFLAGFSFLILLTEAKFRGRKLYYRTGAGASRLSNIVKLGRWKWPALIFCFLVVFMALIQKHLLKKILILHYFLL